MCVSTSCSGIHPEFSCYPCAMRLNMSRPVSLWWRMLISTLFPNLLVKWHLSKLGEVDIPKSLSHKECISISSSQAPGQRTARMMVHVQYWRRFVPTVLISRDCGDFTDWQFLSSTIFIKREAELYCELRYLFQMSSQESLELEPRDLDSLSQEAYYSLYILTVRHTYTYTHTRAHIRHIIHVHCNI